MGRRTWLALAVVLGGALVCLLGLTLLHAELGRLTGFDTAVQGFVHGWAAPWVTQVMLALTWLGAVRTFLPAVFVVGIVLGVQRRWRELAALAFAEAGAFALDRALKMHFHRARPVVPWAIGEEHTFSFPSGHSLFAMVLYGTLVWLALRREWKGLLAAGLVAAGLVVMIGVSRIYLGMHWPTDVLAGWFVGAVWVLVVVVVDFCLGKNRQPMKR